MRWLWLLTGRVAFPVCVKTWRWRVKWLLCSLRPVRWLTGKASRLHNIAITPVFRDSMESLGGGDDKEAWRQASEHIWPDC